MNNDKKANICITVVSVVSLAVMLFFGYVLLNDNNVSEVLYRNISEYKFENISEISKLPENKDISSKAVDVAANGEVIGTITEEFISPYAADTSYNNVYVKNKSGKSLDISYYLSQKSDVKFSKNTEPKVLIVHTHTSECYLPSSREYYTADDVSRSTDTSINVVSVGERIAEKLNSAGYITIHDTTVHDTTYTGSYSRSAETVKRVLSENPSVKLVIDVHRDSVGTTSAKVKPVTTIEGRKTAQVMLVMCCGEGIDGFENWQENLKFAIKYQQTMEVMYPGLPRAMHYLSYKYNQDLSTPSILLEVGTDANSIEEALNAADFAANSLVAYLNTLS